MTEYIVRWEMPIEAEDAVDAAQQALGIHRDPESIATVFFVTNLHVGTRYKIDLDADGQLNSEEPA